MRVSWSWLLICSATRTIEGSPEIATTNTTLVSSLPAVVSTLSACEDFLALMPPRSDPVVVFQVLSKEYISIEKNFVYHMELYSSLTRHHLYIVCLDEESAKSIESALGIRCVQLEVSGGWSREHIWMLRVKVNRCLLLAGYNVIMSDADAIWLNDPIKDMDRLGVGNSSIVAQRDLRPRDLSEFWGVTLCFGFIYFRAGGTTLPKVLDSTTTICNKDHDDQKALNLALFALGIVWDEDGDMACQSSTGIGTGVINDGDEPFVVSLLPHSTYPRWCGQTPVSLNTTVVAHCISVEKGEGMITWMRKFGVWHD